jgi:hypothetical protein
MTSGTNGSNRAQLVNDIHAALTVLCEAGQVVELRIPRVEGKKRTDSGYFTDLKRLAAEAVKYDGRASGTYITLNPVEPALLARAENRVREWADLTTSDDYIARRRWLPIDCDPKVNGKKRPAGISSTEEEHTTAIAKTGEIREWLAAAGWPDPIEADSGNGGALLYQIDLPNDDASKALVEACLKAIAGRFGDDAVDIDTSVYNAARIWKLYGTLAGKGDSTKDRPHRRASLLYVPESIRPVPIGLLRTLARQGEPEQTERREQGATRGGIDAEQWLRKHNISIASQKPGKAGSTIYTLEACPFNADHAAPDACVIQHRSGALIFKCQHDSCKLHDWRALRERFEPGVYERRNGAQPQDEQQPRKKAPREKSLDRPARSRTILDALEKLGYTFRLNLSTDTVEVNGLQLDDPMQARIRTEMRDLDFRGMKAIEDAYTTEALRNAYHPIRDYLDSLVWDGGLHFEALTTYLECTDDPVIYPDGTTIPLCNVYLWRWMIGAVAKVYEQAQNLMLVLAGPQDLGKSTFVAWLCSGLSDHFIEAPINPSDKDMDVRLMGRFIWEVSELDATTRRADVAALKAFITKRVVTVRKSYGRHDTVKPAIASLAGTVNDGSGFLADETGNRRFFVTTLSRLDWSYNKLDINQIWAQVVAAYRNGEPWRLLPVEAAAQTITNKLHEVDGLLEDWIERYFILCQEGTAMSASEIADHLRTKYEIRLSGTERAQAMEIGRVMVKFKIPRRQRAGRGVREYVGVSPREL